MKVWGLCTTFGGLQRTYIAMEHSMSEELSVLSEDGSAEDVPHMPGMYFLGLPPYEEDSGIPSNICFGTLS